MATPRAGSAAGELCVASAVAVASKDGYVVQAFVSLGANPVPTAKQALRDALGRLQNSR